MSKIIKNKGEKGEVMNIIKNTIKNKNRESGKHKSIDTPEVGSGTESYSRGKILRYVYIGYLLYQLYF